ncbi:hypothetical protein H4R20_004042 [Coemansia guatemalensis]|uniref:Uncharacterized protein n=1 Tax=Coemansia guatemalensis TaxID=2761395 RepID=A0A9W8LQV5_9FUNG|nr:hypothetical protein H4R20_004042 [Coemansia guatemalensis]
MANNVSAFYIEQRPKRKPSPGPIAGEPMMTRSRKRRAFGSPVKVAGVQKSCIGAGSTCIDWPIDSRKGSGSEPARTTGKRKGRDEDETLFGERLANETVDQTLKRYRAADDSPMESAEQQPIQNSDDDSDTDHDDDTNDEEYLGIPRLSVIKMPLALRAHAYLQDTKAREWQHSGTEQKEAADSARESSNSALVRYNPNTWLRAGSSTLDPDDSTQQRPLSRSPTADSTSSMDVD